MKRITIYNEHEIIKSYVLNTIETKDLVDKLLSGTNFDILISNQED